MSDKQANAGRVVAEDLQAAKLRESDGLIQRHARSQDDGEVLEVG